MYFNCQYEAFSTFLLTTCIFCRTQDDNLSIDGVFQKDINMRFLQVIAPGRVYPERQGKVFLEDSPADPHTSG